MLVTFDENSVCPVKSKKECRMPGPEERIGKQGFFTLPAKYIAPMLGESKTIVISFAYPTIITPNMDGLIIRMVKEVEVDGIEMFYNPKRLHSALGYKSPIEFEKLHFNS